VDTREAAQRWADVWERGWHEHDADAITALYADGAFWQQHPFREPEPGYLARVFDASGLVLEHRDFWVMG
jgi:hypothetical protein